MRLIAYVNRRYTFAESAVLLSLAVAVVLAAPFALVAVGVGQPFVAPLALALALGAFFAGGAFIDRRPHKEGS